MVQTFAVILQVLLLLLGLFMMVVILLQRGRGGGLAGAFGGLGGQSAFGTKAGDVFTYITIGTAIAWVVLAGVSGITLRAAAEHRAQQLGPGLPPGMSAPGDEDVPVSDRVIPEAPEDRSQTAGSTTPGTTPAESAPSPGEGAVPTPDAGTPATDGADADATPEPDNPN